MPPSTRVSVWSIPRDYTLVMSRVALISARARHLDAARQFINFILSNEGQQRIAEASGLVALGTGNRPRPQRRRACISQYDTNFQPMALGPALLVYLDAMKKAHFLREWESMMRP